MNKKKESPKKKIIIVSDGKTTSVSFNGYPLYKCERLAFETNKAGEDYEPGETSIDLRCNLKELLDIIK